MKGHFVEAGDNCQFQSNTILGLRYKDGCRPFRIGKNGVVRSGSVIYGDVSAGDSFQTGHNVLVREHTVFGDHIVVGTNTVIDGHVIMGDYVKIESNCYIPTHVKIGSRVFIGPGAVLTNDKYPLKMRDSYKPDGPIIEDGVTLGAGAVVCPGITIGRGSFVAAGAVVTKDVPSMSLVRGVPGVITPLPENLRELNLALSWRKYLNE
jgi:acetyltransferase-like isoleucine patch superfamily enzyme